jgi:hypothetical protein
MTRDWNGVEYRRARFVRFHPAHHREIVMGSKRPEQIHKDLLATDSKTRTDDERIHEEDKQALHTRRGKLAIPKRRDNPALDKLKRKRIPRGSDGK